MKNVEVTLISRGKGYVQIVRECRELLEMLTEVDPATGDYVLPISALDTIVTNADDPDHISDPLGRAVYDFILDKGARVVFPKQDDAR